MNLKNNYVLGIIWVILLVTYQPVSNSQGQTTDSSTLKVPATILDESTKDGSEVDIYIDTVQTNYHKFSKLVDKSRKNVGVAVIQSTQLNKDALEIKRQHQILDSLEQRKLEKITKDTIKQEGKSKGFWNIFRLFRKKS